MRNSNWYEPMPADYGDEEETTALVGSPLAPEKVEKASPELDEMLSEAAASPTVKRGRPTKKPSQDAEDEQGTTAKD